MIPQLSYEPVQAEFVRPYGETKTPLADAARGGIALYDNSHGLNVKTWRGQIEAGALRITDGTETFTIGTDLADADWLSFAFDQAMHPVYCFGKNGQYNIRFWDISQAVEVTLPIGDVVTPFVRMDDVAKDFLTHNDVIVTYNRAGNLCCRCQQDRYGVEYVLKENAGGKILKFGMNHVRRLQWILE